MALSDDQKAILRLLTQRGEQGYEDLAALMGIDPAQVHERAQAAAAQLESEGIPAPSIPAPPESTAATAPTDRAPDPEPEAPAAPPPPAVPAPTPAPVAAPKPAPPSPPPPAPPSSPSQGPKPTLPKSNRVRAGIAAGAAILVVLVIVLLVSGGGDSGDKATGSSGGEETISASANPKLTQAVLSPVDGGDAKGVATFGRVKNSLALQIEAEGLEPTEKGQSYTIWLYQSADKMLPLASTAVSENGKIGAQVEVPTEVLAYLANETFDQLDISLTSEAALKASLTKATKEKKAPIYTGTDVLRGTITGPIIGAAKNAKSGK
jgi:hypothetical protein